MHVHFHLLWFSIYTMKYNDVCAFSMEIENCLGETKKLPEKQTNTQILENFTKCWNVQILKYIWFAWWIQWTPKSSNLKLQLPSLHTFTSNSIWKLNFHSFNLCFNIVVWVINASLQILKNKAFFKLIFSFSLLIFEWQTSTLLEFSFFHTNIVWCVVCFRSKFCLFFLYSLIHAYILLLPRLYSHHEFTCHLMKF